MIDLRYNLTYMAGEAAIFSVNAWTPDRPSVSSSSVLTAQTGELAPDMAGEEPIFCVNPSFARESNVPSSSVLTAQTGEIAPDSEPTVRMPYKSFSTKDGLWKGTYTWRIDSRKGVYKPDANTRTALKGLLQRLKTSDEKDPGWRGEPEPDKNDWSTLVEYFKASDGAERFAATGKEPTENDCMIFYLGGLGQRLYGSLNWHLDRIEDEVDGKAESLLWLEEVAPHILKIAKDELHPKNGENRRLTSIGKVNKQGIPDGIKQYF